jgi:predicted RNA-binding Zn-ribbon protein involved in translation (DUF1610 family)
MTESVAGKQSAAEAPWLPYRLRERFLTAPEVALYRALREMAAERYVILAKVALDDIFSIVRPNENVHYFNKLFRKHVDFLLCHPQSLRPQIGVEMVRPVGIGGTRSSDQFMEDLFLTAGLPLVQIPANDRYDISQIVSLFQSAVNKSRQVEHRLADIGRDSIPMCPVCGKMMVLRTHRSGAQAGQLYYGCIDNPTCPGITPLKA